MAADNSESESGGFLTETESEESESESEEEEEEPVYNYQQQVKKLTKYEKKRDELRLDNYESTPEKLGIPDKLKYFTSVQFHHMILVMGGITTEMEILPWDKHNSSPQPEQFTKLYDKSFMFNVKSK